MSWNYRAALPALRRIVEQSVGRVPEEEWEEVIEEIVEEVAEQMESSTENEYFCGDCGDCPRCCPCHDCGCLIGDYYPECDWDCVVHEYNCGACGNCGECCSGDRYQSCDECNFHCEEACECGCHEGIYSAGEYYAMSSGDHEQGNSDSRYFEENRLNNGYGRQDVRYDGDFYQMARVEFSASKVGQEFGGAGTRKSGTNTEMAALPYGPSKPIQTNQTTRETRYDVMKHGF